MRRWSLPLLLAALLAASGCVTVHPGPAAKASPATAATDHKHHARPGQRVTEPALPLSPLPGAQPSAEPRTEPARHTPATTPSRRTAAIPRRTHPRPTRPHQATAPHRAAPPKRAAKARTTGTAKAKPAARTPAPRAARPAPGVRAGDMAALCRSAHGVTSPTIAALCHQTVPSHRRLTDLTEVGPTPPLSHRRLTDPLGAR